MSEDLTTEQRIEIAEFMRDVTTMFPPGWDGLKERALELANIIEPVVKGKYQYLWYQNSGVIVNADEDSFDFFIIKGNPMRDPAIAVAKDIETARIIADTLNDMEKTNDQ